MLLHVSSDHSDETEHYVVDEGCGRWWWVPFLCRLHRKPNAMNNLVMDHSAIGRRAQVSAQKRPINHQTIQFFYHSLHIYSISTSNIRGGHKVITEPFCRITFLIWVIDSCDLCDFSVCFIFAHYVCVVWVHLQQVDTTGAQSESAPHYYCCSATILLLLTIYRNLKCCAHLPPGRLFLLQIIVITCKLEKSSSSRYLETSNTSSSSTSGVSFYL